MRDYDTWKTSPPEPAQIKVAECHCGAELYAGDEAVRDRIEGDWYCSDSCFVAKLRDAGDLVTDTIEVI